MIQQGLKKSQSEKWAVEFQNPMRSQSNLDISSRGFKSRDISKENSYFTNMQDKSSMKRESMMKICVIEDGGKYILEEDIIIDNLESYQSMNILNNECQFNQTSSCDYDDRVFDERTQEQKFDYETPCLTTVLTWLKQDEYKDASMRFLTKYQPTQAFTVREVKSQSGPSIDGEVVVEQRANCGATICSLF